MLKPAHHFFRRFYFLVLLLGTLLFPKSSNAQWVEETYDLNPGWNAVWLSIDTSHKAIDDHINNGDIEEIWLWNTAASTAQFTASPVGPVTTDVRWFVWKNGSPNAPATTFNQFVSNAAYLIKVRDGASAQELKLTGKPVAPRYAYSGSGLNFFGFPMQEPESAALRNFEKFLSMSPDLPTGTSVYRYSNGITTPTRVAATRNTSVKRGEAYWIESDESSSYYGPLRVTTGGGGFNFGDTRSLSRIRIKNVTAQPVLVALTLASSATAPTGQVTVAGDVPLRLRGAIDPETVQFTYSNLDDLAPVPLAKAGDPGDELEFFFSLDRTAMSASGGPGDVFQSILQISDSLGISRIDLPVSAIHTRPEGLWVGEATIGRSTQISTMVEAVSENGAWNPLPADAAGSPNGRTEQVAVWTGTEMILWGGRDTDGATGTGAQFEPITNSWQNILPPARGPLAEGYEGVWTGDQLFTWGGSRSSSSIDEGRINHLSSAIVDGNPAIAYYESGTKQLRFVRASDPNGLQWDEPVVIETLSGEEVYLSLALINGKPAIAFNHTDRSELKFVRANDTSGSVWGQSFVLDDGGISGHSASLIEVDGRAAVAYFQALDTERWNLKFIRAAEPTGVSWEEPVIAASLSDQREAVLDPHCSLAIVEGHPAIAFTDSNTTENADLEQLKFVRASSADGAAWNAPILVNFAGGTRPSMAIIDGNPAIAYRTFSTNLLTYSRANDSQGNTWKTPITVLENRIALNPSLASIGGKPAISFDDYSTPVTNRGVVRFIAGADAQGTNWQAPINIGNLGIIPNPEHSRALVEVMGRPGIAYSDIQKETLKFWSKGSGSGWLYDPGDRSWLPVSQANAPSARTRHRMVWTGTEVIVWGGVDENGDALNNGARYNVSTGMWSAIEIDGAPSARSEHIAVWTGTKVLIWGGKSDSNAILGDGASYDPATNIWKSLPSLDAPQARTGHSAIWTESSLIIWGGTDVSGNALADGASFDPGSDEWLALPTLEAPAARSGHTANWTGKEMILWGGISGTGEALADGARYDPANRVWDELGKPGDLAARSGHSAVWTGSEMIVWGGSQPGDNVLNDGSSFDLGEILMAPTTTRQPDGSEITVSAKNGFRITKISKMVDAPSTFPMRLILHQDSNDLRMLQQVFLGEDTLENIILATRQSHLDQEKLATARRLSSASFPLGNISFGTGSVGLDDQSIFKVNLGQAASTNPFLHPYHPDHTPEKSLEVRRTITLDWAADSSKVARSLDLSWGSTTLGGTYREEITGLRAGQPITLEGTFLLRRVSDISTISN